MSLVGVIELYLTVVVLFWGSLLSILFSYVGYPMLVGVLARMIGTDSHWGTELSAAPSFDRLPEITVLIVAYNAEQHLDERIANILACEYPRERLRIVVASDGSTDGTVSCVQRIDHAQIRVFDCQERRGKAATLIDAVNQLSSPVVVFTDATSRFKVDSLRRLTRHFEEPSVGVVAGKVKMVDGDGRPSESVYWKVEMKVRQWEARLGISLGASGAIYAVRRPMFVAPTRPVINDDLVIPMMASLTHRCGVVFDETALAYASNPGGRKREFERRRRIGVGAIQCLNAIWGSFRWRNRASILAFLPHKLLRWLSPFLLLAVLIGNVALMSEDLYRNLLLVQLLAYTLAGYGCFAKSSSPIAQVARTATSFVLMNAALAAGISRWFANPHQVIWEPTTRPNWSAIANQASEVPSPKRAA